MKTRLSSLATGLLALAVGGCGGAPAKPAGDVRHALKGQVIAVEAGERTLTIAHEDIPNFMPAMTMDFVVLDKDVPLLHSVGAGDEVTATLVTRDSRYWLEDLVVVKKGTPPPPGAVEPHVHEAVPGTPLPDVSLVDQDGRALRLADLRGKAYAVTFVFTRCPLPEFCPLMMKQFQQADALLAEDEALRERARLLTVSFDPKHDTPAVLRRFGLPFQKTSPPFARWTLATGSEQAIRELGTALELDYVEEKQSFTHNLRTAVVDAQGRLHHLFRGNDWKPAELLAELKRAAGA
jgi:protein SCO1/2